MGTGQETRRPTVRRVATRCRTLEELVAAFSTLVDEQSLVVLTDQQRVIGSRQPFVVELSDGQMVMKGEAEVVESTAPPKGRLRLKFLTLDATGRDVHQRMLERKRSIAAGQTPGNGKPRPPTEPGMKPLVRIPEPVKNPPRAPAAAPPRKPQLTPPPSASIPSIPMVRQTTPAAGTMRMPLTIKPPAPAAVPEPVAQADSVGVTQVDPLAAPPAPGPILKASDLPDFEDSADVDTSVDRSIPLPPGVAVKLPVDRPRTAPPDEGDRTPGSPYILPANPFGDVPPESLEAFVECTVYESTGQFVLGENGLLNQLAEPAFEPPAAPPAAAPAAAAPAATSPPTPVPTPTPVPAAAMTPSPPPPAMLAQEPQAPASLPDWARPQATPPPQPRAVQVASPAAADPLDLELERRRRKRLGMILAGIAALGLAVGVIASQCGGGGDNARASAPGVDATAGKAVPPDAAVAAKIPDPVPDPVPVPDPDAVPDPDPEPAEDPGAVPPPIALGPDDCEVVVMTSPPGAKVRHGGRRLGETPLRAVVPCGAGKLSISYRRYASVERAIAPRPGEPAEVNVRLERPEKKVTIRSNPPGATISVNGKVLGKAPVSARVKAFSAYKVKAELAGYQTWSQKVYVKKDSRTFTATMKKSKKKN
jgi:hypothetical protein